MRCPQKECVSTQQAKGYATVEDFCSVFAEGMEDLYQLSFLLTGDHQKAEQCFIAGLEDCIQSNCMFREWARRWAKRTIIQNSIRELRPRPKHNSISPTTALLYMGERSVSQGRHFEPGVLLALEDFERFVFVMSVLERYSEHDCVLFLGCTRREIEEARTRSFAQLMDSRQSVPSCKNYSEKVSEIQ